ncbi:hypothetical protein [Streptomyces sp. NPDC010273]
MDAISASLTAGLPTINVTGKVARDVRSTDQTFVDPFGEVGASGGRR